MPASFVFPTEGSITDLWVADQLSPAQGLGLLTHTAVARLRDGVALADARNDMSRLIADLPRVYPGNAWRLRWPPRCNCGRMPVSLKEWTVGGYERSLWLLFAAVGAGAAGGVRQRREPVSGPVREPAARSGAAGGARRRPRRAAAVRSLRGGGRRRRRQRRGPGAGDGRGAAAGALRAGDAAAAERGSPDWSRPAVHTGALRCRSPWRSRPFPCSGARRSPPPCTKAAAAARPCRDGIGPAPDDGRTGGDGVDGARRVGADDSQRPAPPRRRSRLSTPRQR